MVNQTIERFKNEKLLPKETVDCLKISSPKKTQRKSINQVILEDQW